MYIELSPQLPRYLAITPVMEGPGYWDMIREVWQAIYHALSIAGVWIVNVIPSLAVTVEMLHNAYSIVKMYPHPFHITAWSIFFGPIAILIPSLLLLEMAVLFLLHASCLSHGFHQGSLEDRFYCLKEYFMDTRESLFSVVESWSSVFNAWTSKYLPLLIFRLLCACMGFFTLVGLWTDWHFGISEMAP